MMPSAAFRLFTIAALALVTLTLPTAARADIITVNFADYPLGTDLSTIFEDVTVRLFSNTQDRFHNPVYRPAIIGESSRGIGVGAGDLAEYEDCIAGRGFACTQGYTVFEMVFDTPTNFVEIFTQRLLDYPTMLVYDELGNLLARCITGIFGQCSFSLSAENNDNGTMGFTSESSAISRVLFGALIGPTTIGSVSYAVPEPATLSLVSLGAVYAGIANVRRRRRPAGKRT